MTSDPRRTPDRRHPGIPEITYKFTRLVVIGMALQLVVVGYVFITEFNGRRDAIKAAREGCELIKEDRVANAFGWHVGADARRKAGDFENAERFEKLGDAMEVRARIDCNDAFPSASLFP